MKTPISYYGGKQRIASKIIPHFPKHTVYVEPFCGGAAVLFKKPLPAVTQIAHYREVINDVHGEVVNAFTQLRDNGEALIRLLELTPHARAEYARCKTPYPEYMDELERARRFLYMINNSYSHKENGGWAYSKRGAHNAISFLNKVEALPEIVERLRRVFIEHSDALECIRTWDSPTTLHYVDPPYVQTEQGHYAGYTMAHYADLVKTLIACNGAWVLSGYSWPEGVDMPDDVRLVEIQASSSAAGYSRKSNIEKKGKARVECLWIRQRSVELSEKDKAILARPEFEVFTGDEP